MSSTAQAVPRIKMKKKPNNEFGMSSKTHDVESEEEEEKDEQELSSSSEEDDSEIERELAEVTFEDLQKAKSNGSLSVYKKPDQEKKGGRANKNRPTEVSCKKPVTRFREVVQVPKKVVRDPRFESLCGNLDVEGYVSDKQLKFESAKQSDAAIVTEHKKKEREAAKQGKRPFYLKKSEVRKQRLIEKYNKLKASGKLESFIEKRRRKNAAKDHIYMPYRRSSNSEQQS
ncbi:unnamed protein product [Dovyalis caffra]|uniref:rRNA biogenesis protein RRP36 n=1 Tax=Dovyalis caffra TaxID=77055 RepID=A0AAV1RGW1_9ROSI|nr:unnamed protein product [Dovyalis caffra]